MYLKTVLSAQDELVKITELSKSNVRLLKQIKKLESQRKRIETMIEKRRKKILSNTIELVKLNEV